MVHLLLLLWKIPIFVNEVEGDHDEDEEADDADADGGHGHQAGAGGQAVSQLVQLVRRVAQAAVREVRRPELVQSPDSEIQTSVGV